MRPVLPLLLALALPLAGCVDRYAVEPDETQSAEQDLEAGSFYLPRFDTTRPAHVRVHVEVLEGEAIDAFLAHGDACRAYPDPAFVPVASIEATTNGTFEGDVPAGGVCVVLDNNDHPAGSAPGTGDARVRYQVDVWHKRAR